VILPSVASFGSDPRISGLPDRRDGQPPIPAIALGGWAARRPADGMALRLIGVRAPTAYP